MKRVFGTVLVFGLVFWAGLSLCVAEEYVVIQLTDNTSDDTSPDINHYGTVVWSGYEGVDQEIFLFDGETTTVLQNDSWNDVVPRINNGGRVVWCGGTGSGQELFFYDGSNITRITDNLLEDTAPQINATGFVAWLQNDGNDPEVFRYSSITLNTVQLTDNNAVENNPRINRNGFVVWQGNDGNDDEIFLYNSYTATTTQLTDNDYDDEDPEINDNGYIVWSGGGEIFLYNGAVTTQLTNNTTEDRWPHINNQGHVVWSGNDFVVYQIMLYNGTDIVPISNSSGNKYDAQINDNGYVIWRGTDGYGYTDIYLYDGTAVTNLSNSPYVWEVNAKINDRGQVVWERIDNATDREIFYATPSCQADFTVDHSSGMAPLAVQFIGASNVDSVSWSWDFDNDGMEDSTLQNPTYTYASAGTYTVSLTISGLCGAVTETKADHIVVTDCEADFSANTQEGLAPVAVQFTDLSVGDIDTWSWDFDNDGLEDSSDRNPLFTYEVGGTYTVSLTVSGLCGQKTETKVGYMDIAANKADFTASPREGLAPLTVQFTDLSEGEIETWSWDFDNDGREDSTEQHPVYTYNAAGTQTVRLTVSGLHGQDEEVKVRYIRLLQSYTRPQPVMDYVPQEIGIYDTYYEALVADDCRSCHGASLRDRHHYTEQGDNCAFCHDPVPQRPDGWPDEYGWPPQVPCDSYFFDCPTVERNCVTGGCHSGDDLETNGWHHNGQYTALNKCNNCHDNDYIDPFGPGVSFSEAPPSITPPLVAACENCHWNQNLEDGQGDSTEPPQGSAAHPSSYDHLDPWGYFVGYFEYPLPLYNVQSTHMMEKSGFGSTCTMCHSVDDGESNFDPAVPENIRACERCHSKEKLHDVHMQSTNSWEAVGFHTTDPTNTVPTTYRIFTAQEMCTGCHGYVPAVVEITKLRPRSARPGMILKILGNNFGDTQEDSVVHVGKLSFDATSKYIKLWSNTKIKLRMPKYKKRWYKGKDFRRQKVWVTVSGMDSSEKGLRIFRPCKCDLNKDGTCNDADLVIFGVDMNRSDCADSGVKCKGDLNRDGVVDQADFDVFMEAYERGDCGTM